MEKPLLFALTITILFSILKFLEMKFVDHDTKLKDVVRDIIMVFLSSLVGGYAFFFYGNEVDTMFSVLLNTPLKNDKTQVFTGNPDF